MPGTAEPASSTVLSFFLIDAETNGATVAAFDPEGQLIFTNAYHGGGAAQELVTISYPRIARARITLGQDADTVALDNIRFSTPVSVNHRPVVGAIANTNVDEGSLVSFTVNATDLDAQQTLTFSLAGAPAGAAINPTNGLLT